MTRGLKNIMKILHIIQHLKVGGAQKVLYDIVKKLNNDQHIIITYNMDEEYRILFSKLSNVDCIIVSNIAEYMKVIKVMQYDIVHYHWWPGVGIMDKFFEMRNIPVVVTLQEQCKPPKTNAYYVAGSKNNFRYLEEIEAHKKTYIYFGIDIDTVISKNYDCISEENQFVLGRVSTLYPSKIPSNIFEVFSQLHVDNLNLKLLLCGTGSDEMFNQLSTKMKKYPRCEISIINDSYVVDKYKLMDAFLYWLPEGESESFGLVIVEAMASGVPVITKNTGAMSEIVQHGVNGFLFENESEINECINTLVKTPELRKTIVDNAKETVINRFTTDVIAQQYRKLYQKLIDDTK